MLNQTAKEVDNEIEPGRLVDIHFAICIYSSQGSGDGEQEALVRVRGLLESVQKVVP